MRSLFFEEFVVEEVVYEYFSDKFVVVFVEETNEKDAGAPLAAVPLGPQEHCLRRTSTVRLHAPGKPTPQLPFSVP